MYAGTQAASFEQAARDLATLAELDISDQRVRRATVKIGNERVEERDAQTAEFAALPLPQQRVSPAGLSRNEQTPRAVCVEMDGGRMQIRDRGAKAPEPTSEGFWREMKVGCLTTLTREVHAQDPCPQLPAAFLDREKVAQIAREIKGIAGAAASAKDAAEAEPVMEPAADERAGRPQPLARSVVATRRGVESFGLLLAAAAWARGFAAAEAKAFVADGAEANWGVWRRWFSDYVPILDFVHALCYVYAAALAGRTADEGWELYSRWAQWVWSGQVQQVIAALEQRLEELGLPEVDEADSSPRRQVAKTLGYLRNQQTRMRYDAYRQAGLPITSSGVESTIKRLNRRVKGSEKFWSVGAEALLTLTADHLSDTPTLAHFWQNRPHRLTGLRSYQQAA